jgi:hypothetical protein
MRHQMSRTLTHGRISVHMSVMEIASQSPWSVIGSSTTISRNALHFRLLHDRETAEAESIAPVSRNIQDVQRRVLRPFSGRTRRPKMCETGTVDIGKTVAIGVPESPLKGQLSAPTSCKARYFNCRHGYGILDLSKFRMMT